MASEFKLEARVGYNDDDLWNLQLRVTNIRTRGEAQSLGEALAQQFRDFITSRGGKITGDVVKRDTGLILPDTVN